MDSPRFSRPLLAYLLPFALFMGALAFVDIFNSLGGENSAFWIRESKYWIYPLQTLLCAGVLLYFWKDYEWGSKRFLGMGGLYGVLVFILWVAPQMFFGAAYRFNGFDPYVFGDSGWLFWSSLLARMVRLAIVVPLLEEIFWRGFLLRYLIDEKFTSVPFGTFTIRSFCAVVILFACVHSFTDLFGALAAGVLYNFVAIRTRSLGACVIAHAVTNLLLGIYVLQTQQWGFW